MNDKSILETIREMLGGIFLENDTTFLTDLIVNINTAFNTLYQLGVGPTDKAFYITGDSETWADFIDDPAELNMVKTYIYLKVKMTFDPPTSSFVAEAYKAQIAEIEWRSNVEVETPAFNSSLINT